MTDGGSFVNAPLRQPDSIDRYFIEHAATIEAELARSHRARIEAGAAIMVAQPWRIAEAVYLGRMWPVENMDLTDVLAKASDLYRASQRLGRSGHWAYNPNDLIVREQAVTALLAMILGATNA